MNFNIEKEIVFIHFALCTFFYIDSRHIFHFFCFNAFALTYIDSLQNFL